MLSVVVPIYNVEKFLDKCITSIVNQTYKNIEIILVDDGSSDLSGKICEKWKKKDKRIVVIHKANGGLSSARNAGIEIATGKWISFIDSDDFIELDMFETMIAAAKKTGKDIACCGRIVDLWGEKEKIEFSIQEEQLYSREEAIREVLLLRNIDVSACDKIYKRTIFNDIRYPEGRISEDAAIIFDLLNITNGIVHVGKPFYHYVFRKNSISKSVYNHQRYNSFENCEKNKRFIDLNYPVLKNVCKIYCCQVCGALLQSMSGDKKIRRKYKSDYDAYKKMFNECFIYFLVSKDVTLKMKIKYLFVFFDAYDCFEKCKLFFKKKSIN